MAQLSSQGRFGAALEEAVEGKRAVLEERLRAEVRARQAAFHALNADLDRRLDALHAQAAATAEAMDAKVSSLQSVDWRVGQGQG